MESFGSLRQLRAQDMDPRKIRRATQPAVINRPNRQFMMVNGRGRVILPAFKTDRDIAAVVDIVEGGAVRCSSNPKSRAPVGLRPVSG